MQIALRIGYTLIEIVVALFLFSVGGLALVATSATLGREMSANATRERAERIGASRLEILAAGCRSATGGHEALGSIESDWSLEHLDSSHVRLTETVSYPTPRGGRSGLYRVTMPCPL
jgi:type II secretory pathway component PulJ